MHEIAVAAMLFSHMWDLRNSSHKNKRIYNTTFFSLHLSLANNMEDLNKTYFDIYKRVNYN